MLVIACIAIIVVGPKDLPGMLRQVGKFVGSAKRMAGDFQRQFNDAIKDTELDDLKDMTSSKGFGPLEDARKSMEEFAETMRDPMEPDPQVEVAPPKEVVAKAPAKKTPAKKPAAKPKAASTRKAPAKASAKKPAAPKAASKTAPPKASAAKTTASKAKPSKASAKDSA